MIVYKLFVLDNNIWNRTTEWKFFVFDKNILYHLCANQ